MIKLFSALILCIMVGCQYLPNDVKDFAAIPEHKEQITKCVFCHTVGYLSDKPAEKEADDAS